LGRRCRARATVGVCAGAHAAAFVSETHRGGRDVGGDPVVLAAHRRRAVQRLGDDLLIAAYRVFNSDAPSEKPGLGVHSGTDRADATCGAVSDSMMARRSRPTPDG